MIATEHPVVKYMHTDRIHTHHTLSIDTGVIGLTDVTRLGAAIWSITIAYVAWRTGTYRNG